MADPKTPSEPPAPPQSGGISLPTLIIASIAAAVASYIVSRVWGRGTIVGAAASPIVVALASEFLRRPVQTVSQTARRVPRPVPLKQARAPRGAYAEEDPTMVTPGRPRRRVPPVDQGPVVDPGLVAAEEAEEVPVGRRPMRWDIVAATAAIAFTLVVAVYTVPDLVAGRSITGNGNGTTFFGGSTSGDGKGDSTTTTTIETTSTGVRTVTTTTPTKTTTVPGQTQTTTAPTPATPTDTTPVTPPSTDTTPTTTTPAPTSTQPSGGRPLLPRGP